MIYRALTNAFATGYVGYGYGWRFSDARSVLAATSDRVRLGGHLGFVRKVGSQATVDARHAYHRLKATCQLFIACGDAATFFKPTKAAFYRIPLPIFGFVEPPG